MLLSLLSFSLRRNKCQFCPNKKMLIMWHLGSFFLQIRCYLISLLSLPYDPILLTPQIPQQVQGDNFILPGNTIWHEKAMTQFSCTVSCCAFYNKERVWFLLCCLIPSALLLAGLCCCSDDEGCSVSQADGYVLWWCTCVEPEGRCGSSPSRWRLGGVLTVLFCVNDVVML